MKAIHASNCRMCEVVCTASGVVIFSVNLTGTTHILLFIPGRMISTLYEVLEMYLSLSVVSGIGEYWVWNPLLLVV